MIWRLLTQESSVEMFERGPENTRLKIQSFRHFIIIGFKLRCLTWPVMSAGPNAPGPAAYHATERLAVRTTRRRSQLATSYSER